MKPEIKTKWIDALLSGKYKQGWGRLFHTQSQSYCCLGVLADICGKLEKPEPGIFPVGWIPHENDTLAQREYTTTLPQELLDELGLDTDQQKELWTMNDGYGYQQRRHSFEEIAQYIQENL